MAESEEELKSLLMKVKEESEKPDLKINIQKLKIMASSLITSWQIDGESVEIVSDIIFLCSKIAETSDCSHEVKRHLLLGRIAMANLDRVLKSRDIHFADKAMIFPLVLYAVQSLKWDDPMGKEMASHSSILAWEILWTEEPGKLCP